MMLKCEEYYYTDSSFQLELNLQDIRRDLTAMLDNFEQEHCVSCRVLKCHCSDMKPRATELTDSGRISQVSYKTSDSKTKDVDSKEAPPAKSLPKPKWDKQLNESSTESSTSEKEANRDTEAWVRAVTPSAPTYVPEIKRRLDLSETNGDSAVPWSTLKSAWIDGKKSLEIIASKNAVETFFHSFKGHSTYSPTQTTLSSRLATTFKVTPKKSYEYTYF